MGSYEVKLTWFLAKISSCDYIERYVGCPSKNYTKSPVLKLSICREPDTHGMKETFIRNEKRFKMNHESLIV